MISGKRKRGKTKTKTQTKTEKNNNTTPLSVNNGNEHSGPPTKITVVFPNNAGGKNSITVDKRFCISVKDVESKVIDIDTILSGNPFADTSSNVLSNVLSNVSLTSTNYVPEKLPFYSETDDKIFWSKVLNNKKKDNNNIQVSYNKKNGKTTHVTLCNTRPRSSTIYIKLIYDIQPTNKMRQQWGDNCFTYCKHFDNEIPTLPLENIKENLYKRYKQNVKYVPNYSVNMFTSNNNNGETNVNGAIGDKISSTSRPVQKIIQEGDELAINMVDINNMKNEKDKEMAKRYMNGPNKEKNGNGNSSNNNNGNSNDTIYKSESTSESEIDIESSIDDYDSISNSEIPPPKKRQRVCKDSIYNCNNIDNAPHPKNVEVNEEMKRRYKHKDVFKKKNVVVKKELYYDNNSNNSNNSGNIGISITGNNTNDLNTFEGLNLPALGSSSNNDNNVFLQRPPRQSVPQIVASSTSRLRDPHRVEQSMSNNNYSSKNLMISDIMNHDEATKEDISQMTKNGGSILGTIKNYQSDSDSEVENCIKHSDYNVALVSIKNCAEELSKLKKRIINNRFYNPEELRGVTDLLKQIVKDFEPPDAFGINLNSNNNNNNNFYNELDESMSDNFSFKSSPLTLSNTNQINDIGIVHESQRKNGFEDGGMSLPTTKQVVSKNDEIGQINNVNNLNNNHDNDNFLIISNDTNSDNNISHDNIGVNIDNTPAIKSAEQFEIDFDPGPSFDPDLNNNNNNNNNIDDNGNSNNNSNGNNISDNSNNDFNHNMNNTSNNSDSESVQPLYTGFRGSDSYSIVSERHSPYDTKSFNHSMSRSPLNKMFDLNDNSNDNNNNNGNYNNNYGNNGVNQTNQTNLTTSQNIDSFKSAPLRSSASLNDYNFNAIGYVGNFVAFDKHQMGENLNHDDSDFNKDNDSNNHYHINNNNNNKQ